jgi:hypothetical protein
MEIRDRGLYKDVLGFETFEAYCKAKWDFTRMYAHYLIESSRVVENVNYGLQYIPVPENERQARPIARPKEFSIGQICPLGLIRFKKFFN